MHGTIQTIKLAGHKKGMTFNEWEYGKKWEVLLFAVSKSIVDIIGRKLNAGFMNGRLENPKTRTAFRVRKLGKIVLRRTLKNYYNLGKIVVDFGT